MLNKLFVGILSTVILMTSYVFSQDIVEEPKRRSDIEFYIFSADNCSACKILKDNILVDVKIKEELSHVKVVTLDMKKLSRSTITTWKVERYPQFIAIQRISPKQVQILDRWMVMRETSKNKEQNRASLLKFIQKYVYSQK